MDCGFERVQSLMAFACQQPVDVPVFLRRRPMGVRLKSDAKQDAESGVRLSLKSLSGAGFMAIGTKLRKKKSRTQKWLDDRVLSRIQVPT